MTENTVSTTIEILGKPYAIKCPESQLQGLQQAACYVHEKMIEVQESGKAINLERIAIITALNIAFELLQGDMQKTTIATRINQHILHIQEKLDTTISKVLQTELAFMHE